MYSIFLSLMAFIYRRPVKGIKRLGQGGDYVFSGEPQAVNPGGLSVQPGGGASRHERGHSLGDEPGDDSRKNVAGPGGGKSRRSVGIDHSHAVRSGNDGIGPFKKDDGIGGSGG